jgi:hypothetical protein
MNNDGFFIYLGINQCLINNINDIVNGNDFYKFQYYVSNIEMYF